MQDEQLYQYLASQKILESLPLEGWFENCFAEILPIVSLQRIWDKILGGSSIIMVFVVISLLSRIRQTIFKLNNVHKLVESIKKLTESIADMVVTEAIQLWQQYGSPIVPGSNNDCLKDHHKAVCLASHLKCHLGLKSDSLSTLPKLSRKIA
jgi:hypothetical protein